MKRLENKTEDAKREMDMMGVLDDILHTKGKHAGISTEAAVAALKARASDEARAQGQPSADLTAEDEAALEQMVAAGAFTRRLDDAELDGPSTTGASAPGRRLAPAPKRVAAVKRQRVASGTAAASVSGAAAAAGGSSAVNGSKLLAANGGTKPAGLGLGGYGASSSSEDGGSAEPAGT